MPYAATDQPTDHGRRDMPFDAATYPPVAAPLAAVALIDAAADPCPTWTAENPDRALAFLFVAPRDCAAVDVLVSL